MQNDKVRRIQVSNEVKKTEIVRQLSDVETNLSSIDIETKIDNGFRLPFDQVAGLGVAFGSLPEAFRTIVSTASVPALVQMTDKFGNPLDPSVLQRFSDGSGLLGSYRDKANGFVQARLHAADPGVINATAVAPFDPSVLFMAIVLMQVNKKLDAIQEIQKEMLEYMRQKDKAALRGNLKTLTGILSDYRYNWDNSIWRKNAHMKTEDIKQESDKDIVHLRAQIMSKVGKKGLADVRFVVDKRMEEVLDRLKEYQIAVYNYTFASFLEPLMSENYDEDYLAAVVERISDQSLRYRELYTMCYNAIEDRVKSSVDAMLLGGLSLVSKKLGEAVAATPVGDRTRIDEALGDASDDIGEFNGMQSEQLVQKLHQAKSLNILPFIDGLDSINSLYNKPMQLLADRDSVYLVPVAE